MSKSESTEPCLPGTESGWTALLEQLPGFVMLTSGPDHLVEFANAGLRELSGYRDIVGHRLRDALPELIDQGFLALRDEVYRTGEPYRGRATPFKIRRAAGGPLEQGYIDFVYQPLKRPDGSVSGIIFAGYDITEQKQAEDQMRSLQFELIHIFRASAMGAMAMILAHELNQPLAAISNYAAGARRILSNREALDAPELASALDDIESASHRASDIIRLVREMIEKGPALNQKVDLDVAIRQAAALGLLDAPRKGVAFTLDLTPKLIVSGHPIQLQQIILNLLRNAVDAMQGCDRRELEVASRREGDEAEIRVSDTGAGLSDEVRDRLFEPFNSSKEHGLGVGLSICRVIVERHCGRIWAEDRAGGGTHFFVRLPLAA